MPDEPGTRHPFPAEPATGAAAAPDNQKDAIPSDESGQPTRSGQHAPRRLRIRLPLFFALLILCGIGTGIALIATAHWSDPSRPEPADVAGSPDVDSALVRPSSPATSPTAADGGISPAYDGALLADIARESLEGFLRSEGEDEGAYLLHEATIRPAVEEFRRSHGPKKRLGLSKALPIMSVAEKTGFECVPFMVELRSGQIIPAYMHRSGTAEYKLNWPLWVQCKHNLLERFVAGPDGKNGSFHVNLKRGHNHDQRLAGREDLHWFIITQPGSGLSHLAFAPKTNPQGKELNSLEWQTTYRVRVEILTTRLLDAPALEIAGFERDAWGGRQ